MFFIITKFFFAIVEALCRVNGKDVDSGARQPEFCLTFSKFLNTSLPLFSDTYSLCMYIYIIYNDNNGFLFLNFIGVQLLCNVVLVSAVQQSKSAIVYIYPLILEFLTHVGHHRALSRVPCAIQQVSLVIYFIQSISSIYMSIPISQFIPSHHFPLWHLYVCSLCL